MKPTDRVDMDTNHGCGNLYSIVEISERTGRAEVVYFCNCRRHRSLQAAMKCGCQKQKPRYYKIDIGRHSLLKAEKPPSRKLRPKNFA